MNSMSKQMRKCALCWAVALGLQAMLAIAVLRTAVWDLRFEEWLSYLITPGYAIMQCVGDMWSGPMPISDSRWICGAVLSLAVSVSALMSKEAKWNILWNVLFVIFYLIGALFCFVNMAGVIT